MIWNRKAIVLNFILAILIALIIFVPTILFASELFRLSDQGETNFKNLVSEIKRVNQEPLTTTAQFIFIQDEKTYLYPVTDQSRGFHVTKDPIFGNDVDFTLSHTAECQNQNCLCLCRAYKGETDRTCTKLSCEPLPDVTFSPGTGQIIDRGTEGPRRQRVRIIKCKAGEPYCKQSNDGDISLIFDWVEQYGVYDKIK